MSQRHDLAGRHIVLGLTGGIACYKAAELTRELVKAGASVQVVMTEAAEHFIGAVTMQALSQLLKAANTADKNFIKKCKDKDFRELFTMEHGDLPSVQTAIANLPKELDDEALHETLFKVFRSELPKRVSDEQVKDGVNLYVKCLQDALLPVKDFGLHVLHSELKEIGKDVKDIKGNVDFLVEKAKASSQGVADTKNYARFLVPFPHNPDFVGRDAELSSLHDMLQQGQSVRCGTGFAP